MKEQTVHGSNGLLHVIHEHKSKRGKVYKRRRKVVVMVELPKWWSR